MQLHGGGTSQQPWQLAPRQEWQSTVVQISMQQSLHEAPMQVSHDTSLQGSGGGVGGEGGGGGI